MADILTPCCPLCGGPPVFMMGGGTQAFCGSDDCRLFTWNPTLSRSENLQSADFIDLTPREDDTGER